MDHITFQVVLGSIVGIGVTVILVCAMLKVINYWSIEKQEAGGEDHAPDASPIKQHGCGLGWVAGFGPMDEEGDSDGAKKEHPKNMAPIRRDF